MSDEQKPEKPQYTAEKFVEFHPQRAQLAIDMLAQGFNVSTVAKKVHASWSTIKALRYLKEEEIKVKKAMMNQKSFYASMMALDHVVEKLPEASLKEAAIVHGITRDTFVATADLPPPVPQVHVHVDVVAQFKELLDAANKKAEEIKEAKVLELPA